MDLLDVESRLFTYKNDRLLQIFSQRYLSTSCHPSLKVEMVFQEFKKFIYVIFLVQTGQVEMRTFQVIRQLEILDQFWHQFILMTFDYQEFCEKVFGCYIHHEPETGECKIEDDSNDVQNECRRQIELVKQVWGHSTARAWYVEMPLQIRVTGFSRLINLIKKCQVVNLAFGHLSSGLVGSLLVKSRQF